MDRKSKKKTHTRVPERKGRKGKEFSLQDWLSTTSNTAAKCSVDFCLACSDMAALIATKQEGEKVVRQLHIMAEEFTKAVISATECVVLTMPQHLRQEWIKGACEDKNHHRGK